MTQNGEPVIPCGENACRAGLEPSEPGVIEFQVDKLDPEVGAD